MRIGILKTDAVREDLVGEFGEYPEMFAQLLSPLAPEFEFVTYDVEEGELPDNVDDADAYLITGSKSSVYEDKPWIHGLNAFVQQLHAQRKKLVGICFGHQMVAQALGGNTEKSNKGWGVGAHSATFDTRPSWHDGGDMTFSVLVSHQDQVTKMAPGSQRLAGSDFCENAVIQIGEHILTFQGHPEFVKGYSDKIMDMRRETIGEETYMEGKASLSQTLDRKRVGQWMVNFLRS